MQKQYISVNILRDECSEYNVQYTIVYCTILIVFSAVYCIIRVLYVPQFEVQA